MHLAPCRVIELPYTVYESDLWVPYSHKTSINDLRSRTAVLVGDRSVMAVSVILLQYTDRCVKVLTLIVLMWRIG